MKDFGFFAGALIILLLFSFQMRSNQSDTSGSFGTTTLSRATYRSPEGTTPSTPTVSAESPEVYHPKLTPAETEAKVAELYTSLDSLKEDLRVAQLWDVPSPYREMVTLSLGNVWTDDPDSEYLTLTVRDDFGNGIAISDWYLESYVTDERAGIPDGDRLIERWRSPNLSDIVLFPNEYAYIISGYSPIDASFRENICTGYLNDEEDFRPYLNERCPSPMQELESFGRIKLDNDSCYELIERMSSCQTPDDDAILNADINRICEEFIETTFDYNSCVENHRYDPYFARDGYWYIYLRSNDGLWREKREIIRLIDENDRVVDVLEY